MEGWWGEHNLSSNSFFLQTVTYFVIVTSDLCMSVTILLSWDKDTTDKRRWLKSAWVFAPIGS